MSDERFEIPNSVKAMAEANFAEARKAFEGFLTQVQDMAKVADSKSDAVRTGARDVSDKAVAYVQENMKSSLDHAERLLHAKDPGEVLRLHAEYIQSQMKALAQQTSEIGQTMGRVAMDAVRPKK